MPARDGWIDVTRAVRDGMRTWPGAPEIRVERVADTRRGAIANVSRIRMGTHTGTHVDAPCHLAGLRGGVERLPLAALVGPARVVQAGRRRLHAADLPPARGARRLLLRGGSALLPDAAHRLAASGVRLVGTDAMSIDPDDAEDLPAHRVLLAAGVVVIESLDLAGAPPGRYDLIALPLLVPGADGAPVRALLRRRGASQRRK